MALYDDYRKREYHQLRFQAALHGVDLDKETKKKTKKFITTTTSEGKEQKTEIKADNNFIFQDPEVYEKLSKEERTTLTNKMMKNHKDWVHDSELSGRNRTRFN